MRSHDHHSDVTLKPRKKKPSKEKSDQSSTQSSCWPNVMISHDKKSHDESNDPESNLSRFDSTVNDSNVVYDIVELLCDGSKEERPTCPRIFSSKEFEEQDNGVCSTCKNCAECQLQQQQQQDCAVAKIRKTEEEEEEDQDEDLTEHLDYYEAEVVGGETDSMVTSIEHEKSPILVDLTREESKQTTWKQTILKRFGGTEVNSEMSGENVIMSKSGFMQLPPPRQSSLILMSNIFSRIYI